MNDFQLALAVFLVSHVVVAIPAVRRGLIARWSERGFLLAYVIMSVGLFAWLIPVAMHAPTTALWPPALWAYWVPVILMPIVAVLLGASVIAPNPLSIAFVPGLPDPQNPGAVALSRHPILWGLALWGLSHVPPNGDTVMLTLFGGLGVFGLLGMLIVERKKRSALGEERWRELAAGTSFLPFVALLSGRARWPRDRRTLLGAAFGAAVAAFLLLGGHVLLFNRDPLALF
ncbi:MAG: NnrU family protein [Gammaproteobacteria bacterium]|nr:NnrU family protein [Gammaproteobacteria bacterium]